jgi:hypothetical protein
MANKKPDFKFEVAVPQKNVSDVLADAFECGACNYWSTITARRQSWDKGYDSACLLNSGSWTITDNEANKKHTITKVHVLRGMKALAKKYPHHFNDVVSGNYDNYTSDALVQCAVFGEIMYG